MSEQTPQPVDVDDPGLTAYALGELEGPESERYAAAVASSTELQAVIAEIQAEARLLTDELAREPQIPIAAERRIEIAVQAEKSQPVASIPDKRRPRFARRTMAVAASIALIPGAWYAYQIAFPKSGRHHSPETLVAYTAPPDAVNVRFQAGDGIQRSSQRARLHGSEREMEFGDLSDLAGESSEASPVTTSKPADSKGLSPFKTEGYSSGSPSAAKPQSRLRTADPSQPQVYYEERGEKNRSFEKDGAVDAKPASQPGGPKVAGKVKRGVDEVKAGEAQVADHPASESKPEPTPKESGAPEGARPGEKGPHGNQNEKRAMLLLAEDKRKETKSELKRSSAPQSDKGFTGERLAERAPQPVPQAALMPGLLAGNAPSRSKLERELKEGKFALAPSKPTTFEDAEAVSRVLAPLDPFTGEAYKPIFENAFITPKEQQLSTFSIDVDTASYANLRRFLQGGQLPPPDAVRIEELVNYFAYQYPQPQDGRPFSVQTDIAACPWQPSHQLVRIGLKGKEIPKEQRTPTNLVFLVDVSGSMQPQNRLPLVRESLTTLVNQLDERDKVAIVTYAGEAGLRLPSTSVAKREVVLAAIAGLGAGGSTNGAAGINTAYDIAAQEFIEKGTNRVILCTDGDFNVGVTSNEALVQMIQTRAKGGVFLSVFGFGMGNLKDDKLEELADKGNGQYGYIDDQQEANKVFVQELMGTLVTIAKDVKIQIDFNPETVASYRLVGYENRIMAAEDFHNDKKDAGEIGAGHTVTALYEIAPTKDLVTNDQTRWLTVKLRYKQPDAATSVLFENPLIGQPGQLKLASSDFQFAASVAACGMLLRHSQHAGKANWGLVKELAQSGLSYDPHGHRRAFLGLVSQAESLMGQLRPVPAPATDSTVGGKYKSLLRRVHAPGDTEKYGQFNDYGHSDTKSYAGSENLPEGYWVYAAPYWYIWAETTQKATN